MNYISTITGKVMAFVGSPVARNIFALTSLEPGWFFGKGKPVHLNAVVVALRLQQIMQDCGWTDFTVSPEESGGILVMGFNEGRTLEVLCYPNEIVDVFLEEGNEEKSKLLNSGVKSAEEFIRTAPCNPRNSSYFFTRFTTWRKNDDTTDWHFKILKTEAEYPSLIRFVSQREVQPSVSISSNFTRKEFQEVRPHFGESRQDSYVQV